MTLEDAIEAFLLERRRLAYGNERTHRWMLRKLLRATATRLPEPLASELIPADVDAVVDEGLRLGHAPETRFHTLAIVRGLCRWLIRRNVLLLDPSRHVVLRRPPPRVGFVPSPSQVRALLHEASPERALLREGLASSAEGDPEKRRRVRVVAEALREKAILELLYGSGLRFSELRGLDVSDLQLGERTLLVRSGKGKKDRVVPMTRLSVRALSVYLSQARPTLLSQRLSSSPWTARRDVTALFVTAAGGRLGKDWPRLVLRPLARVARLPRDFTPHRLRHACAVHLLESGADVVRIGRLLGHASLNATALYLRLTTASLEKTLLAAHPRENQRASALHAVGRGLPEPSDPALDCAGAWRANDGRAD